MNKIELLAPAKNLEFGIAAINSGADAVYIGASNFGARKSASNTIQDIEKLINFAHLFKSSVYVTVNTLFFDDELKDVEKLIYKLYEIGADAIIFQDMSILEMNLPPIKLFASTQTNNYSIDRIKFFDRLGIDRIILARELSVKQIQEIRKNTSIELESFIFGALCVSLSGQCYMSRYIGNRSANRGDCAQPCRNVYSLYDQNNNILIKDKHLLSIRDLNLENYLPVLIESGITSFKIEGRLKDIDYVVNVVSYFRKKLDELHIRKKFDRASSGFISSQFTPNLSKTFNRGFTNYFITAPRNKISSFLTPKFVGEEIGKVIKSSKGKFDLDSNIKLCNGDGLCYFVNNELNGIRANRIDGNTVYLDKPLIIKEGTKVFRNFDKAFNDILSKIPIKRKISAIIKVEYSEKNIIFTIIDEDSIDYSLSVPFTGEIANDGDKQSGIFKTQLSKTGNSVFFITEVKLNLNKIPLIKISELNNIRNILTNSLHSKRIESYKSTLSRYIKSSTPYYENTINYKGNVINSKSKQFYLEHDVDKIESGFEEQQDISDIDLMTTKYCLRYEIDKCLLNPKTDYKGDLYLKGNNKAFLLEFDCENCMMKIKPAKE
jgi:collagenase-like PrtC family protease